MLRLFSRNLRLRSPHFPRAPSPHFSTASSGGSGGDEKGGSDEGEGGGGAPSSSAINDLVLPFRAETSVPDRMPIGENTAKPKQLLAFPIARRPVFPGFIAAFPVRDEDLVKALMTVKASARPFVGLFLVKEAHVADYQADKFVLKSPEQVHAMGTMAHIQMLEPAGPGGLIAYVMSHRRVRITGVASSAPSPPPLVARVEHVLQPPMPPEGGGDHVKALVSEILSTLRDIIRINPLFEQNISFFARKMDVSNPYNLADFATSLTSMEAKDLQDVLETLPLQERLEKALFALRKELQICTLQQSIKADVEKRLEKTQRHYYLQEQLKSIKKELGLEKDDKEALIAKFAARVEKLALPATAQAVYNEEVEKLGLLERNSSEFNVTRTYLDWLTSLPWGKFSTDNFDIGGARVVLDEDHYGMSDVKDRILEFIAVGTLRGTVQGKILCLVGPPGVGKTSVGKSIARALNRQFYRFSVGGLSDVAEIKGHRRTYVGAMPGKLIQCLKSTGVSNPLVLIDEIDKIGVGRGYGGDPSSALLELLDPSQNSTFIDHYLDTPVDASKVLFICTANSLDTVPGPLLDRMEVIRLSGYDGPEKLQIVKRYLDPKTRAEVGLERGKPGVPATLALEDSAVEHLIRWYARESGVRNLEKLVGKIYRKAAMQIVLAREKVAATAKAAAAAAMGVGGKEGAAVDGGSSGSSSSSSSSSSDAVSAAAEGGEGGAPPAPAPAPAPAAAPPPPRVEDPAWTITPENLDAYVGKPVFTSDRLYTTTPSGVAMGLAWTNMGGSSLYIEVASPYLRGGGGGGAPVPAPAPDAPTGNPVIVDTSVVAGGGKTEAPPRFPTGGSLRLTGKMGDVMQESAQIAYTFARGFLRRLPGHSANDFLDVTPLHMHVPEGATPKDGPSAGTCMTTALLSAALDE